DQTVAMKSDLVAHPRCAMALEPHGLFPRAQDAGDCRRQAVPVGALFSELLPTQRRERVESRLAPGVRCGPFRAEPAPLLQSMKGRVKRPLMDLEHGAGHLLQALRD